MSADTADRKSFKHILDDVLSRFVLTLPKSELALDRLFVQLQEAQWFYEDYITKHRPDLPQLRFKDFSLAVFKRMDFLRPKVKDFEKHWKHFQKYLRSVPTFGTVILNETMDKVVLVQNLQYKVWGFPKGKMNFRESPEACAAREVLEETGFDIRGLINPKDFLEAKRDQRSIRLYFVAGVSEKVKFKPLARNEISEVRWFSIKRLVEQKVRNRKKFGNVLAIAGAIQQWAQARRKKYSASGGGGGKSKRKKNRDDAKTAGGAVRQDTTTRERKAAPGSARKQTPRKPKAFHDNSETFGDAAGGGGWSAEDMFRRNAELGYACDPIEDDITAEERAAFEGSSRRGGRRKGGRKKDKGSTEGTRAGVAPGSARKQTPRKPKAFHNNSETFGDAAGGGGWSAEDMFRRNAELGYACDPIEDDITAEERAAFEGSSRRRSKSRRRKRRERKNSGKGARGGGAKENIDRGADASAGKPQKATELKQRGVSGKEVQKETSYDSGFTPSTDFGGGFAGLPAGGQGTQDFTFDCSDILMPLDA